MRWLAAAAVAALLVPAAGCGGGGGGERLSRDAYVAKADSICRDTRPSVQAPSRIAQIPAYIDRLLPTLERGRDELRALRPPKDLDDEVNSWLDSVGQQLDLLKDLRSAAEKGDVPKVRALGAHGAALALRSRSLARSIGLVDCANR